MEWNDVKDKLIEFITYEPSDYWEYQQEKYTGAAVGLIAFIVFWLIYGLL